MMLFHRKFDSNLGIALMQAGDRNVFSANEL